MGIGRISPASIDTDPQQSKFIQPYESERVYQLPQTPIDVLLTHHSRRDFVVLERGVKIKASTGMQEIEHILDRDKPAYHFFGHYGGPAQACSDFNRTTLAVKLANLQWEHKGTVLEAGSMGLLHWHSPTEHTFEVLKYPWLKEYTSATWEYL